MYPYLVLNSFEYQKSNTLKILQFANFLFGLTQLAYMQFVPSSVKAGAPHFAFYCRGNARLLVCIHPAPRPQIGPVAFLLRKANSQKL